MFDILPVNTNSVSVDGKIVLWRYYIYVNI